jgi:hypothetical protein
MSFDVHAWYDDNVGYNDNDDDTAPELVASRREWYHFHDPRSEDLPGDTVEKATESIAKLEKYIVDCETRAAAIKKQLSDVSRRGDIKLVDDVEQAGDNPSTLPDDVRPCSIESSSYHYDPCDEKPALITPDCIYIQLHIPSSVVV